MSVLSSLKLVAAKRPQAMPTIQVRRNKLGKQLFEQIKLATALREGKTYAPLQLRNVRNKESGDDLPPACRTKVMEQSPLISENSGYETIQIYR